MQLTGFVRHSMAALVACMAIAPLGCSSSPGQGLPCKGQPAGFECRAAAGPCDVAELCDGVSNDCPTDGFAAAATACDDGVFCNGADTCDGAGTCVHAGDPCAANVGDADQDCSESCNESAGDCSAQDPTASACSDGVFCNGTESCDASGVCGGSTGDPCAANVADGDDNCAEACNEGSADCSANEPAATACSDGTYCNGTETCDGSGVCGGSTGDPCAGNAGDADANCAESCNEVAEDCTSNDPDTSFCTLGNPACEVDECQGGTCVVSVQCPIFVDGLGSDGSGCGTAWGAMACATPQGGADEAVAAGVDRVFVKDGTYRSTGTGPLLTVPQGISFYGGMVGTEALLSERGDPLNMSNSSILDGDTNDDDVAGMQATYADNAAHVVVANSDTVLDGFVVQSGAAPIGDSTGGGLLLDTVDNVTVANVLFLENGASGTASAAGGAVAVTNSTAVTVTDVDFIRNRARATGSYARGGAMLAETTDVTLNGVVFDDNQVLDAANRRGGALASVGSSPSLTNVDFFRNDFYGSSGFGAGMYAQGGNPSLTNVLFESNNAGTSGQGGGLYVTGSTAVTTTLNMVTFESNSAQSGVGGGMLVQTAGASLTDVDFLNNNATDSGRGGGIALFDTTTSFTDVDFINNNVGSSGDGGGLFQDTSVLTFNNVTFTDNDASFRYGEGGALYGSDGNLTMNDVTFNRNYGGTSYGYGGGMYLNGTIASLTDVEFDNNSVTYGGGGALYAVGGANVTMTRVQFINSSNGDNVLGGALSVNNSIATMTDVLFDNNSSDTNGEGGAIAATSSSTVSLTNGRISNNTIGGASGGGLFASNSTTTLTNVEFLGNRAGSSYYTGDGGGAFVTGTGSVTMTQVSFTDNRASGSYSGRGGGLFISDTATTLTNVVFDGNSAVGFSTSGRGGGLYLSGTSTSTLDNVTFVNNTAVGSSGSYGGGVFLQQDATATLNNVVFTGNSASSGTDIFEEGGSTLVANDICSDQTTFSGTITGLVDNMGSVPVVRSASGNAFLDPTGTCVDTGNDTTADAAFGAQSLDWRNLSTDVAGLVLDTTPVDPGYHHDPGTQLWVVDLVVDSTNVSWVINAPAGTTCEITSVPAGFTFPIPTVDLASGSTAHGLLTGDLDLSCELGVFVSGARQSVP